MKTKNLFLMVAILLSINVSAQKYYWYAGQIKPNSISEAPTTSNEYLCNNWFELGDNLSDNIYKLVKGGASEGGSWFVAVPCAEGQTYYPSASDLSTPDNSVTWTDEFITVNGISYHIFEYGGVTGARNTFYLKKFDENLFIVFPPRYVIRYGDDIPDLSENSYSVYNTLGRTLSKPIKWSTEATNFSPWGSYEIVADLESVEENILFYHPSFINIRKAPLIVGVKDETITEGDEIPAFTLVYDGFKNNETEVVLSEMPTATTTATSFSKAGTYPIIVSGGKAQNYSLSYEQGTLTIEKKIEPVTITANDQNMTYGDDVPTLTYKSEGGQLKGTPSLTTTATKTSPVGTYPITVAKGTVTNEQVTYVAGTLTITKAPLTVGVKNETITEGDAIPAFTLTYSGFRNSDTEATAFTTKPVAKTTATPSSPAGTYPITVSGGEAQNYALTYGQGTLTIEEKEVDGVSSVKADEQPNSATYNLAGQKVNAQYKGIVIRNGKKVMK